MKKLPRAEMLLGPDWIAFEARLFHNFKPIIPIQAFFLKPATEILNITVPNPDATEILIRKNLIKDHHRYPILVHIKKLNGRFELILTYLDLHQKEPDQSYTQSIRASKNARARAILNSSLEGLKTTLHAGSHIAAITDIANHKSALVRVDADGYLLEVMMASPDFDFVMDPDLVRGIHLSRIMDTAEYDRCMAVIAEVLKTATPSQLTYKVRSGKKARLRTGFAQKKSDREVIVIQRDHSKPVG